MPWSELIINWPGLIFRLIKLCFKQLITQFTVGLTVGDYPTIALRNKSLIANKYTDSEYILIIVISIDRFWFIWLEWKLRLSK
ncbi:MAG: hypothetical protein OHM56_06125 [Spiroplasma phoeniceum]|nr:MAG: hypothetical protein OHM57_05535 [Spiroplasma phoeniceum]UZQ33490.1 MAG: hypothetical protein OHM56_06125 [Spiroplasma phoeniceum]